ncbi:DUF937 domain-containing protein [Algoriphagus hitonicola]|uniref:DUF937 domain-containing protein n=1 Tax=Algoriphagus hitonicola TaxID=435880 RepID=A0A1I2VMW6_9BACT|nr:DUF937 domain-containing protein [Algoriphagus hitonicola]SFG90423.1 hypothetical protein SAMN04487988_11033 [Algoriphagus hitonicola]
MIDQLLKMADGPLRDLLANSDVPANPGDASAIEDTLASILQRKAQSGDLDALKEMFSGADTNPNSPVVNNLAGDVSEGLKSKLGIDGGQAMKIAMAALPMLMNFFNKKVNDAPQDNSDIMNSVIGALQGGGGSGQADILGSLLGGGKGGGGMDLGGLMNMGKGLFK